MKKRGKNPKHKIEKRIKPLVDILNEVPYIATESSCEGHYLSKDPEEHKAKVFFGIKKGYEKEFENLAALILSETASFWPKADIKIFKRYYVLPEELKLTFQYIIEIKAFEYGKENLNPEDKRKNTDEGIKKIIEAIESYLKSYKENA